MIINFYKVDAVMKIKSGFMLRNITDCWIVVPIGERVADFNGLISLNDTGAFLWRKLQEYTEQDKLVEELLSEYDIDKDTAKTDVEEFVISLANRRVLDN
jgi:hypothetical protein